jgi:deazaflavin-dependent oxidoreductase (nitroreductase family)
MANPILRAFAKLNAVVYRMSGGRVMGKMGASPICVVRMQGARSHTWRDVPLMYVPNGAGVILVASLGGAPKNPVWYYNLVAHPDIEVQVKESTLKLRARLATLAEKAAVWPACVAAYPAYADYQKRTTRDIPVFICDPR